MQNPQELIIGRNPVSEALKSGRPVDCLYIAKGNRNGLLEALAAKGRESGVTVKYVDIKKLDFMCGHGNHQGVAATAAVREYASLDDLFALAESRGEAPLLVICDEIEDPHNLGSVIRCADAAGAHGVIIPERRSATLTYAAGKASAGAVEYVPVAKVKNLVACIGELKERGVWIFGADTSGKNWFEHDFTGPCALVIGSEGKGLGRLVREKCDFLVSLPMKGRIDSLNASVAAGIILFEAARQRL